MPFFKPKGAPTLIDNLKVELEQCERDIYKAEADQESFSYQAGQEALRVEMLNKRFERLRSSIEGLSKQLRDEMLAEGM